MFSVVLRLFTILLALVGVIAEGQGRVVNVAVPAASISQIPFYVGQERGYFKDEGLEVNLIVMGAAVANLALIGQNVDFSYGAHRCAQRRASWSSASGHFHCVLSAAGLALFKAGIRAVKDLKGKRVGVAGIGSGPDHLLRELLRENGMDPGRDVTILGLGVQSNLYTALSTGNLDASVFVIPGILPQATPAFLNLSPLFIKIPCNFREASCCGMK